MNYFLIQVTLKDRTVVRYAARSEMADSARQLKGHWEDAMQYGEPMFLNGAKVSRSKYMNALATHRLLDGAYCGMPKSNGGAA